MIGSSPPTSAPPPHPARPAPPPGDPDGPGGPDRPIRLRGPWLGPTPATPLAVSDRWPPFWPRRV